MATFWLAFVLRAPLAAASSWTNPPASTAPLPDWFVNGGEEFSGRAAVADFDGDGFSDIAWTRHGSVKAGRIEWQRFDGGGPKASGVEGLELPRFQAGTLLPVRLSMKDTRDQLLVHAADPASARERGEWRLFSWRSNRLDWGAGDWSFVAPTRDERVGNSVAVGDFNGDRWNDLAVGTGDFSPRDNRPHRVDLFLGSRDGLSRSPSASLVGERNDPSFASALLAVDLDGDGRSELLVGSELWTSQVLHSGRLQTYSWEGTGLKVRHSVEGDAGSLRLGYSMAGGTDWTGDGRPDVVLGLPGLDSLGVPGRIRLFQSRGGAVDLFEEPNVSGGPGHFGSAIAVLNNAVDGRRSLFAVSSPKQNATVPGAGMVSIFSPGENGSTNQPVWLIHGDGKGEGYGAKLIGGFDINHDGYGDLLIATRFAPGPNGFAGKLELVLGSPSRWTTNVSWVSPSNGGVWRTYSTPRTLSPRSPVILPAMALLPPGPASLWKQPVVWIFLSVMLCGGWLFREWRHRTAMRLVADNEINHAVRARVIDELRQGFSDDPAAKALLDHVEFKDSSDAVWLADPANDSVLNVVVYLTPIARRQMTPFKGVFTVVSLEHTTPTKCASIPSHIRRELLFICRELLNNVLKHSAANECRARLDLTEGGLLVEVSDNGRGFDLDAPFRGNGLANLHSRAGRIGATVQIKSVPDSGTTTTILVPLSPINPASAKDTSA